MPPQPERALHIRTAALGSQLNLCTSVPCSRQRINKRQFKVTGQLAGLVEASVILPAPVERNGHDMVGAFQQVHSSEAHQISERPCQRTSSVVFQSMNDFSKRAGVLANCSRSIDNASAMGALPAALYRPRKRITAPVA
jgi:hypothetical protein